MDENMIYKGHKDYKELMLSEDFKELVRKNAHYAYSMLQNSQCILKGDILKIVQEGFDHKTYLTVCFDNFVDMLGYQTTIVVVPEDLYPSDRLFANTGIEAEVVLEGYGRTGYNTCEITKWIKYNADLMFPHYMCPTCGHDYGFTRNIALNKVHQYCEICEPDENDGLIPIYNKNEYDAKIKRKPNFRNLNNFG